MMFFYKSLMHRQYPGDEGRRLKVIDNYNFVDFVERLFQDIEVNPSDSRFNAICTDANDYKGKKNCAYNLAAAFAQAFEFLQENVSKTLVSEGVVLRVEAVEPSEGIVLASPEGGHAAPQRAELR